MSSKLNLLEDFAALLNANVFYREFSFSTNNFILPDSTQLELADHLILIDDLLIIFQLKQRGKGGDEKTERNWFRKKVIRKGSAQIRDTLNYLAKYPQISITNQKGHRLNVAQANPKRVIKIILYLGEANLPLDCVQTRFHFSSTGGRFIHVIPWHDYLGIARTLLTPMEVVTYFEFREELIENWDSKISLPSEKALVGYFLSKDTSQPTEKHFEFLHHLKKDDFDISWFVSGIGDRIERSDDNSDPTDYYAIIAEFAKLFRSELREAKLRIKLSLETIQKSGFRSPMRIIASTGCGFIFIPLKVEFLENRVNILNNLTLAAKYDLHLDRQVGISFIKEDRDFLIDFYLANFAWSYDEELEIMLKDNNPFPPMSNALELGYEFED